MDSMIALAILGISVGMHWGVAPAFAAVAATYALMPYKYR